MKKFLSFALVLIAVCSLASCGKKKVEHDVLTPDQIDKSKDVTISFYHAMGQANQAVITSISDKFTEAMKEQYGVNVVVEQTSSSDYNTLKNTLSAAIAGGDQPTLAQTYPDHVSLYLEGDAVVNLDKYNNSEFYALDGNADNSYNFIPKFFAEGRVYDSEKNLYSIPFNKSSEVLYYNKTIFEKYGWDVPKTWEDVISVAEKFVKTDEYKAASADGGKAAALGIDSEDNAFITLTQQWGGQFTGFNADGEGEFLFNNAKTKEALAWLVDQFNKRYIVSTTYFGTNYCSDAFKAGQCIMTIGSSAGAKYNVATDGSFVTGVTTYPQRANATEDEKQVIQQGTNVTLFKCEDAQEELFGWLFIKFLTNYESSLEWTLNTGYFPIRQDVANSDEYKEYVSQMIKDESGETHYQYDAQKEACKVALTQSDYFYTSVAFPGSSKARTEAELIIQEILYNPTEYTIDKAIKQALDNILYS